AVAPSDARPPSPGRPDLLVKHESLQSTGAVKPRGAHNAIRAPTEDPASRPGGVVAHSSGNHGFAIAYAAAMLGVKAAIVVPRGASRGKAGAIAGAGEQLA